MDKRGSSLLWLFIPYSSQSAVRSKASIVLPSRGQIATPMLAVNAGCSLSAAIRLRMRDATNPAAAAVVSGKMTANSSPPYLAAVSIARQLT